MLRMAAGVVLWFRSFLCNSLGPVQSERRSAAHRPCPVLLLAAFLPLCLLLPPDYLLLLFFAFRLLKKAHSLHVPLMAQHRASFCPECACFLLWLSATSFLRLGGPLSPLQGLSRVLGVGGGLGGCGHQAPPEEAPDGVSCHWRRWGPSRLWQ